MVMPKNTDRQSEDGRIKDLRNEDPLSGEPGAHPVATGIGAALGGAATGAAIGTVAGPIGTVLGTAVGAVAGGLAGKAVGENNDPTQDIEYWRGEYAKRPYYNSEYQFEDYESAYRAGIDVSDDSTIDNWEQSEDEARNAWRRANPDSPMDWEHARLAAEDAYNRRRSTSPKPR